MMVPLMMMTMVMYIGDVGNNADDSDSAVGGVDGALDECQ